MSFGNYSLVEGVGEILGPPSCRCDFAFLMKALCSIAGEVCTPADQGRTRQLLQSLQSKQLVVRHLQSEADPYCWSFVSLPSRLMLMVLLTICLLFSLHQFQQLISLCPWVF